MSNIGRVIAILTIASFAIERVTNGLLFLLSYWKWWNKRFPEPASQKKGPGRRAEEKKAKLIYACSAGTLIIALLIIIHTARILEPLGLSTGKWTRGEWIATCLDFFLTWLLLLVGSDQVSALLKSRQDDETDEEEKPIEITGTVYLQWTKEERAKSAGAGTDAE
jgi:hypothetical protein